MPPEARPCAAASRQCRRSSVCEPDRCWTCWACSGRSAGGLRSTPPGPRRLRGRPDGPAIAVNVGLRDRGLVLRVEVVERHVQVTVLEAGLEKRALLLAVPDVVICIVEPGDAQTARKRAGRRERADCPANLERRLVVRLGRVIALAVVDADVNVAVVAREVAVERGAQVRRGQEAFAFGEHRALEPVPVDTLVEVDEGRLLLAEAHPRAAGNPVVEVDLAKRVLQAQLDITIADARDVRRDAVLEQVRHLAVDVDIRTLNVERARVDRIAVRVPRLGTALVRVVRKDRRSDTDRRRVVGRGVAGRRRHLRDCRCRGQREQSCRRSHPSPVSQNLESQLSPP